MRYSCKEPRQFRPFHPYREGSPSSRAAQVIWSAGQAVRKSITVDERRPFLAEELTYIPLRRCSPNMPILNTDLAICPHSWGRRGHGDVGALPTRRGRWMLLCSCNLDTTSIL